MPGADPMEQAYVAKDTIPIRNSGGYMGSLATAKPEKLVRNTTEIIPYTKAYH